MRFVGRKSAATLLAAMLAGVSAPALAQVPADKLLVPPADAQQFLIISSAGQHGTTSAWRLPDGSYASRFSMNLRGQIFEVDQTIHVAANGQPDRMEVRGFTPSGDSAETFEIKDGKAHWKNKVEDETVAYDGVSQYSSYGGTPAAGVYFAESLYKAPGKTLKLLPAAPSAW